MLDVDPMYHTHQLAQSHEKMLKEHAKRMGEHGKMMEEHEKRLEALEASHHTHESMKENDSEDGEGEMEE